MCHSTGVSKRTTLEQREFAKLDELLNNDHYFIPSAHDEPEFNPQFLQKYNLVGSDVAADRAKAQETFDEVEQKNHYIDFISPDNLTELPVGMKKKIGKLSVTIGISSARLLEGFTLLTIFCKIQLPQEDPVTQRPQEIFFGADNVKLTGDGGLVGEPLLVLLGDFGIAFNGGNLLLTLKGGQSMQHDAIGNQKATYAKLECGGLKELGLYADISFPKNRLVPLNADYSIDTTPDAKVKGSFNTIVSDWSDILAEITLPPFAFNGFEKIAISVDNAVFDFSDSRNSPDVVFPTGYENLVSGNPNLWRGVYVNKLKVVLPKEIKKQGTTERVSFEAGNMLIDNMGITGNFAGNNILQLGSASGWEFSVDKFAIDIQSNEVKALGFEGYIALPLTKRQETDSLSKTAFKYTGIISFGNHYLVQVKPKSKSQFSIWQATAHIDENSYIELLAKNDKFYPKAVLNGRLEIGLTKQSAVEDSTLSQFASFKGIEFQGLTLQTEAPYLQVRYLGYKGEVSFGNFPVSLYDISITTDNLEVVLGIGMKINFHNGKISADAHVNIVGQLVNTNERYSYEFDRVDLNAVNVNADFQGFKLSGSVRFTRNDPVMGSGFNGRLKIVLDCVNELTIEALGAFGNKPLVQGQPETFRYWYVDALVSGLPPQGAFNITGFGGGASYHMQRKPDMSVATTVCPTQLGYVPNAGMGMAFRAVVLFDIGTKGAAKGEAGFEIQFTPSYGLANIGLFGKVYFMPSEELRDMLDEAENLDGSLKNLNQQIEKNAADYASKLLGGKFTDLAKSFFPEDKTVDSDDGEQFYCSAGINYDFQNSVLHADAELFVNMAKGIVRGRGANNKAGWLVLHFAPKNKEWYLYLGTPSDRLGLRIGIAGIGVQAGGYLMMGKPLLASPPPPQMVASILGVQLRELDYMRDANALSTGAGFAFGVDFSINTGDLRFLLFYASLQAGFGFDIMIKDYGEAHCKGSNDPIGINGWFANGQGYAYLQGELGIEVKFMLIKKRIPIITAGAAALFQAKLPNPTWLRGYVEGHFNVLGGAIKGKFRFKVTVGTECEIENAGPLDGLKVIADFSPADKATEVDVFAAPQAVFNMPVEKSFSIDDDQGTKTYRIKLDEYSLKKNGQPVAGKLKWNVRNDAVMYVSSEILPPHVTLTAKVRVSFEQQNGGQWQPIYEKGKKAIEEKVVSFTTGLAPNNIPLTNIEYCYPVVDQKYFYPKEYTGAYVQLSRGQSYLFDTLVYQQQAQFAIGKNTTSTTSFAYDSATQRVHLTMPDIQNSQNYIYSLVGLPQNKNSDGVTQQSQNIQTDGNNIQVADNKASGVVDSAKPRTFLTYNFSTSRYGTFIEKMQAKSMQRPLYEIILSDVGALQADINGEEGFDIVELSGSDYTNTIPLIQPIANLNDPWYLQDIYPLLYANYPPMNGVNVTRDITEMGLPPAKAVEVIMGYLHLAENTPADRMLITRLPHRYYLAYYYKSDFVDLQYQIVNRFVSNRNNVPNSLHNKFVSGTFPVMRGGKYPVTYQYVLPGNIPRNSHPFEFENPLR